MKSLNLVYSSSTLRGAADNSNVGFFQKLGMARGIILRFKKDHKNYSFGPADENEVGRGRSYAVFPELELAAVAEQTITLDAIRAQLARRGVTDEIFQDKILVLLLQSKVGLQFAMGQVFNGLMLDNGHYFAMKLNVQGEALNNKVELKVKNGKHVKLVFSGVWTDTNHEDVLKVHVEIDITPHKVAINSFKVNQLSKNEQAQAAFSFLEANQVSILQKFVMLLKQFLGYNSSLQVENEATDKIWLENNANIPAADEVSESDSDDDYLDSDRSSMPVNPS